MKTYTIIKTKKGRVFEISGTVEELTKHFSYPLLVAASHGQKINQHPTTIKSLMSNLNKALDFNEGRCYERTSLELKA